MKELFKQMFYELCDNKSSINITVETLSDYKLLCEILSKSGVKWASGDDPNELLYSIRLREWRESLTISINSGYLERGDFRLGNGRNSTGVDVELSHFVNRMNIIRIKDEYMKDFMRKFKVNRTIPTEEETQILINENLEKWCKQYISKQWKKFQIK